MFWCFLLDSLELQETVSLTKHGGTFSSLNISRRTYCSSVKYSILTICCCSVVVRGSLNHSRQDKGSFSKNTTFINNNITTPSWRRAHPYLSIIHCEHSRDAMSRHVTTSVSLDLWWTCLRYDNFFLTLETKESISEIDSHHIFQAIRAVFVKLKGGPQARW